MCSQLIFYPDKTMRNTLPLVFLFLLKSILLPAQESSDTSIINLFADESLLKLKLEYSRKKVKWETNDSIYMPSQLFYLNHNEGYQEIPIAIRKRGNFRLRTCYFPPAKIKIKKAAAKESLFEDNRELKLVLPCLVEKRANDCVVIEYLAYRLYQELSPIHFKTRLLDIDFVENKGRRNKEFNLKGIFIEDIKGVAKRSNARVLKRKVHPLQQNETTSLITEFFQFMIGNTDFSTAYQHNGKLIFMDGGSYPVPYDFDMSGMVNSSYSVVSNIQGKSLGIENVRQRLYRGFERDVESIQKTRSLFLDKKERLLSILDEHANLFENKDSFQQCRKYISEAFLTFSDDKRFKDQILDRLRTE